MWRLWGERVAVVRFRIWLLIAGLGGSSGGRVRTDAGCSVNFRRLRLQGRTAACGASRDGVALGRFRRMVVMVTMQLLHSFLPRRERAIWCLYISLEEWTKKSESDFGMVGGFGEVVRLKRN